MPLCLSETIIYDECVLLISIIVRITVLTESSLGCRQGTNYLYGEMSLCKNKKKKYFFFLILKYYYSLFIW